MELDEADQRPRVEPVVVPRWIQLVALPLGVLLLWSLVRAAGPVFLVFIVASVIALILNPLVTLIERGGRLPRGVAVLTVYLGFVAILLGIGVALANPISNQVTTLQKDVPHLVDSANNSLADVQDWLDRKGIGIEIKRQGETALETLQDKVLGGTGDLVSFSSDLLKTLVAASFAVILVLVISVYMLLYSDRIGRLVRTVFPPGDGTPEDDYPLLAQKAVFSYVVGQLAFSLIMGVSAGVALWIFGALGIFPDGQTYAVAFGVFFGLMELIPYVGPILGALPPILVALFQDPISALWVTLLFVGLQQLEGHVVAPQVFGHALRINPLLVIFSLLVGFEIYGIIGAFLALPIAAVARETTAYLRRHLILEPWGTPTPAEVLAGRASTPPPLIEITHCPDCGATLAEGDAFCRNCGTPVGPDVPAPR
jgi:predicted PurR-regulated permease PerM